MEDGASNRFVTGGARHGLLAQQVFGAPPSSGSVAPGTVVGAFEIVRQIGSGGMGTVHQAVRISGGFEQTVAIKMMWTADETRRARFRAEMEILASLAHPNIAQLIDGGETAEGWLYLAMELIDGVPIDEYCESKQLSTSERLRLLLAIADALAHAHRNLVIHRDIKPNNILVSASDGRPRLLDFGIAKLFDPEKSRDLTVQFFGPMTPMYAAPEQFRGDKITVATDVYQFGMLMYRLLSGGVPFRASVDDPMAWARAVLDDLPVDLSKARRSQSRYSDTSAAAQQGRSQRRSDRDLDAIVQMALAKDPNQRYGSMHALASDLQAYLQGDTVTARNGGVWYRASCFLRRHRLAVALALVAMLGMTVTTISALRQAAQARAEAARLGASVELLNGVFEAAKLGPGDSGGRRSLEAMLDTAAKDVMQRLDQHPDLRASALLQVADGYTSLGLPARAAPLYELAIAGFREQSVPDLVMAGALERGALTSYWKGDLRQARAWIDEARTLAVSADDAAATIRDGLFQVSWNMLRSEGRLVESAQEAQRSVHNAAQTRGPAAELLMANALVRRGTSGTDLEQFDNAERDLQAAVDTVRRVRGENHANTLSAMQALGWHYGTRGDHEKGLAILEPVGARVREVFGDRSVEWARNLFNRANIYKRIDGRWESALAAYLEASDIYRASSSAHAVQVSATSRLAADLLRTHGRCAEAMPLYAEVHEIWTRAARFTPEQFAELDAEIASCASGTAVQGTAND